MDDKAVDLQGPIALGVMCKAPWAGTSKTRLSPPLSREEAASLSRCFIADIAATVGSSCARLERSRLRYVHSSGSPWRVRRCGARRVRHAATTGDDLSERCANAIEDLPAQGCVGACLLNADSPTLPAVTLEAAIVGAASAGRSGSTRPGARRRLLSDRFETQCSGDVPLNPLEHWAGDGCYRGQSRRAWTGDRAIAGMVRCR